MIRRKRIFLGFKFLMALVYLSLGAVILSSNMFLLPVKNSVRICFGILLILYGSFRIYTLVFNTKSDETN